MLNLFLSKCEGCVLVKIVVISIRVSFMNRVSDSFIMCCEINKCLIFLFVMKFCFVFFYGFVLFLELGGWGYVCLEKLVIIFYCYVFFLF